jgi:hypothetical protein
MEKGRHDALSEARYAELFEKHTAIEMPTYESHI